MPPKSNEAAPIREGEVLAEKYRIERVLGQGGMGIIVAARHIELDERVAIKFLRPSVAQQHADFVVRFQREGRAVVKIKSEHVARVKDVGTWQGAPYIVMEHLEGRDLAEVLRDRGRLPIEEAIEYLLQACEALAEAHAQGIVHRDLKPANFFLTRRADRSVCIKVLDFGISKMLDVVDGSMTETRDIMGSPYYMSPEQMKSPRDVDPRSDIWSLGVILFELVSGTTPFRGESMLQLAAHVLEMAAMSLSEALPDAPPELGAIIARCLVKNPEKRYANIGQLAAALGRIAPLRAQVSVERIARIGIESDTEIDDRPLAAAPEVRRDVTLTAERPIPPRPISVTPLAMPPIVHPSPSERPPRLPIPPPSLSTTEAAPRASPFGDAALRSVPPSEAKPAQRTLLPALIFAVVALLAMVVTVVARRSSNAPAPASAVLSPMLLRPVEAPLTVPAGAILEPEPAPPPPQSEASVATATAPPKLPSPRTSGSSRPKPSPSATAAPPPPDDRL